MEKSPLVSIIVPVYNVEAYIEECLDSIVDQTYNNIEIIVVDDGSTDNSYQKIQLYLTDNRVQLIKQENKGLSGARNTGLRAATGKYILFVDSDDYIETTTIKEVVEKLEKNQVDLIRFNGKAFLDEIYAPIEQNVYDFSHRLEEEKIYTTNLYNANRRTFVSPVYLYIIKRDVLKKHDIYFYEGILHEDELFTAQIFLAIESMMYMNRFYYNRRYRENSIMTTQSPERLKRTFDSYLIIYKELEQLYFNQTHSKEQRKMIKRQMLSIYSGMEKSPIEKKLKDTKLKNLTSISLSNKLYLQLQKVIHSVRK